METAGYFGMGPAWQIVILVATSFCTWLFGKLQTKRERRKADIEIINGAITPLLESIKGLTERNNQLVEMYLGEQQLRMQAEEKNRTLEVERDDLARKVSELSRKVDKLERTIKKFAGDEKDAASDN